MPTIPIEKAITELLEQYSKVFCRSKRDANKYLSDACMAYLGIHSFKDIMYIYKQVLMRYQLEVSFNYMDAAYNLKMKRSTLAEIRRLDKGNMSVHMPKMGF